MGTDRRVRCLVKDGFFFLDFLGGFLVIRTRTGTGMARKARRREDNEFVTVWSTDGLR